VEEAKKKIPADADTELSAAGKTRKPWVPGPDHPGKKEYEKRENHKQRS
jgi:hypothetical protein